MSLTVRQLEVFAAVAKVENVTRGAQRAHLTQPAASMALRQLETTLGGPVFTRAGRRLVLNDRGRWLLPRVEAVLDGLRTIEEFGRGLPETPAGDLVVGCSTTIGNYVVPPLLKAFSDAFPEVDLHLRVSNTEEVAAGVRSGVLDGGLIEGEVADPRLRVTRWMRDELVVVTAPEGPLASRSDVAVDELAAQPWVVRELGSGTRSTVESALAAHGIRLDRVRELGPTTAVKGAVAAGMGVTCLSRAAVARELRTGALVEVSTQLHVERWFRTVTRRDERSAGLLDAFFIWLREHAT
jgi:DNA-binding transcriptional LysR family regulator